MPKTEKPKGKDLTEIKSSRQLLAVKKISEVIGKSKGKKHITIGKILRESGYSLSTSLTPDRIVQGDKFQELLEQHLPDNKLAEVHELLVGAEFRGKAYFNNRLSNDSIKEIVEGVSGCRLIRIVSNKAKDGKIAYYASPDSNSRLRAITEAYKLKNKYPAEQHEHTITSVRVTNYADTTPGGGVGITT